MNGPNKLDRLSIASLTRCNACFVHKYFFNFNYEICSRSLQCCMVGSVVYSLV